VFSTLVPPEYRSSARILVGTCASGSLEQAYHCGLFTLDRTESYAALAVSDVLAQRVIDELQLDRSAADLAGSIEATAKSEEAVIEIAVTDSNANDATRIADSAARQFVEMITRFEVRNSQPTGDAALGDTLWLDNPAGEVPPENADPFINLTIVDAPHHALKVGPGTILTLLFGAIAGLVVGLVAAAVRDRLDSKIHEPEQVTAAGVPVLGVSPRTRGNNEWTNGDDRIDAFRRLRLATADGGQVVAIVSPRRGTDAAAAAVDYARASAEAGANVLLVDAETAQAGFAIGERDTELGLADLLRDPDGSNAQLQAVYAWNSPAIRVLGPGVVTQDPPGMPMFAEGRLRRVVDRLRYEYDLIVVNCPPALDSAEAIVIGDAADAVILVVRVGETTEQDVATAGDMLRAGGATVLGALVVKSSLSAKRVGAK
jgi:receptor protein-tyrosine kinase